MQPEPGRGAMSEDRDAGDATPLRRALAAEKQALSEIEQARSEARSIVADARARARTIEQRATERIARVERAAQEQARQWIEAEEDKEKAAFEALERAPVEPDALQAAAEQVASMLTADADADAGSAADTPDD